MHFHRITRLIVVLMFASCSSATIEQTDVDPQKITADFNTWWKYHYELDLSANYIAQDTAANVITKEAFLKTLTTGAYVPLRVQSKENKLRLFRIPQGSHLSINDIAKSSAKDAYRYFLMEGKPLPGMHFTDINGNTYTPGNTAGKIVVLKCWFIHCQTCVAEMPELNKAIAPYQKRGDVLFVSLAFETREQLKTFLQTTRFDYAVVANKERYMIDTLQVSSYPTHILINKEGNVSKIVDRYEFMLEGLKALTNPSHP